MSLGSGGMSRLDSGPLTTTMRYNDTNTTGFNPTHETYHTRCTDQQARLVLAPSPHHTPSNDGPRHSMSTANNHNNRRGRQQNEPHTWLKAVGAPPGTFPVIDPHSKRLFIPMNGMRESRALHREGVPSLCCLYLEGRCRQGANCYQAHADPDIVKALRPGALSQPTCCPLHGSVLQGQIGSVPPPLLASALLSVVADAAKKDAGPRAVRDATSGPPRILASMPMSQVNYTTGLRILIDSQFLQHQQQQATYPQPFLIPSAQNGSQHWGERLHLLVPQSTLCQLHLQKKGTACCRFEGDCKFIHICREAAKTIDAEEQIALRRHNTAVTTSAGATAPHPRAVQTRAPLHDTSSPPSHPSSVSPLHRVSPLPNGDARNATAAAESRRHPTFVGAKTPVPSPNTGDNVAVKPAGSTSSWAVCGNGTTSSSSQSSGAGVPQGTGGASTLEEIQTHTSASAWRMCQVPPTHVASPSPRAGAGQVGKRASAQEFENPLQRPQDSSSENATATSVSGSTSSLSTGQLGEACFADSQSWGGESTPLSSGRRRGLGAESSSGFDRHISTTLRHRSRSVESGHSNTIHFDPSRLRGATSTPNHASASEHSQFRMSLNSLSTSSSGAQWRNNPYVIEGATAVNSPMEIRASSSSSPRHRHQSERTPLRFQGTSSERQTYPHCGASPPAPSSPMLTDSLE